MEYDNSLNLVSAPGKLFFVGIGGIGMSGLAQLLVSQGYSIAGSDRGLSEPGKADLYKKLRRQGIRLYEQDGSGVLAESPDELIVSTAVEDGNPDLVARPGIPVLHRARALAQAIANTGAQMIGIAGSCGKTSVTGWIASALHSLGESVLVVNGGYYAGQLPDELPGNFMTDTAPRWAVVEIDESDHSINTFSPDYGVLLNVGNDHYEEDELRRVFAAFLGRCKKGIVCLDELRRLAAGCTVPLQSFAPEYTEKAFYPDNYAMDKQGISFDIPGIGHIVSGQSGHHSALNATAVAALLKMLPISADNEQIAAAIAAFPGICQRFEVMGTMKDGTPLVNDYAHNPEKIQAAISTAQERFNGPVLAVFQPHGFRPLEFMREALAEVLAKLLRPGDIFCMLPVFYAGGSASFKPSSEEVVAQLTAKGIAAKAISREDVAKLSLSMNKGCILVMGARDSSLRPWTASFIGR
ncbi:MAG: hypothetical protein IKP00_11035 [Victivallales bacterium]|nr:hypothetical protein [Victivallales bacterium]